MSFRSCLSRVFCCCCCETTGQQIFDGGPPASPGHQSSYSILIHADEASPSFNAEQSILRIDILDVDNQYLTNISVPCFLFKLRNQSNDTSKPPAHGPVAYKSLSNHYESWQQTQRSNVINFSLIRRNPLTRIASIRLTHDCYTADAHLTLKHILIRDDESQQCIKADLLSKPIRALHVCPPSGLQVFPVFPAEWT